MIVIAIAIIISPSFITMYNLVSISYARLLTLDLRTDISLEYMRYTLVKRGDVGLKLCQYQSSLLEGLWIGVEAQPQQ